MLLGYLASGWRPGRDEIHRKISTSLVFIFLWISHLSLAAREPLVRYPSTIFMCSVARYYSNRRVREKTPGIVTDTPGIVTDTPGRRDPVQLLLRSPSDDVQHMGFIVDRLLNRHSPKEGNKTGNQNTRETHSSTYMHKVWLPTVCTSGLLSYLFHLLSLLLPSHFMLTCLILLFNYCVCHPAMYI